MRALIDDGKAIIFLEDSPNSVRLLKCERLLAAGLNDWAGGADRLCRILAILATRPTLSIWMEEHFGGVFAAGSLLLPIPIRGEWPWLFGANDVHICKTLLLQTCIWVTYVDRTVGGSGLFLTPAPN